MVTNCVKLVPLSQTLRTKILYESYAWFPEALKKAAERISRNTAGAHPDLISGVCSMNFYIPGSTCHS